MLTCIKFIILQEAENAFVRICEYLFINETCQIGFLGLLLISITITEHKFCNLLEYVK